MTKQEKEEVINSYELCKSELSEYVSKARRSGYKCQPPKLPKNTSDHSHLRSTLMGFTKRFSNWKNNLLKFEESKEFEREI
jgi:hypothetical protein